MTRTCGSCQIEPFLAVEGIDRWPVDHQFSDARVDTGLKCGMGCAVHMCSWIGKKTMGAVWEGARGGSSSVETKHKTQSHRRTPV